SYNDEGVGEVRGEGNVNGVNMVVNGRRIGTKRGLGAGRSRGWVRSRVIHTVHVERTRSTNGFAVWPQNRGGDEDGVLSRVKANGRPVQVTAMRFAGQGDTRRHRDGFPVWPQNRWWMVSRFSLKTVVEGFRFRPQNRWWMVSRFRPQTDGGRFPGFGLKTGCGGWWCTWHHREGSFEVKLSCEGPDGIRVMEKMLN
ncbi:hypothetical protein EJB05_56594, partial [Eragrostis curvula]